MMTQIEMYRNAEQKLFEQNLALLALATDPINPLTNQDLERLIARWPERYGRFSGWIGKLKDETT